MLRTVISSRMVCTATHSSSLRFEMVGFFSAGKNAQHRRQALLAHVQHQPHAAQRIDGAIQQQVNIFQFAALRGVFPGVDIGDQLRVRFKHCFDDAQLVGAQR